MTEPKEQFGRELIDQIRIEAAEVGVELVDNLEEVALYTAERIDQLSLAVGEPGFELALVAERDNIAMMAAAESVEQADALDARILAVFRGGLAMAARGLRIMTETPPA